ncbi:MAG TPA: DNA mismatch repair protein MutS [Crocinitomicaceae bacterium]|nr:DNA mismatch repair protein MutS [Crocinitomicaceae bacterium]
MKIDKQTLDDLEFTTIQKWLQNYAISDSAKEKMQNLQPSSDREKVLSELHKVNELLSIRTEGETFPRIEFEELLEEIKLLPIKNSAIQLEGFMRVYSASMLINNLLYFFDKRENDYPLLSQLIGTAYYTKEIIDAIQMVFDKHGKVKDDASDNLLYIRTNLKSIKKQINRNFDKEVRRLRKDNILGDTSETFINERRVLTVLANHKRKISGSVVGSSKAGNYTYIEPQINVALNNEYELLLDDERKEIFKILQVLKTELLIHIELIKDYQRILVEFDFINAKTRLAIELECCLPAISEELEIEIKNAFHPILLKNNNSQKKKTLPQQIEMNKFARMLVISGPNAGGKSITLKSIGILQLMLQSGILVPVHPNSKMCLFQNILSDIGDNQSIENELSTYSYRLKRMNHFLQVANKKTLLLLDEFGTGSDPDLGGALAEVIFEALYNKKSYAVITTHYNNIKLKANQLRNAVNGSMLFNTETLEPRYEFSMGQPGSSFTFEVAKINGIPDDLIEEAKNKLSDNKVKMDKLLSDLQKEKSYLNKLNKEHIEAQDIAENARNTYTEKKEQYEHKLQNMRANSEFNQKHIHAGKKLSSFIEKYNINTKKKAINDKLLEEVRKYLAVEKSKIVASKQKEKLKKSGGLAKSKKKTLANNQKKKDPHHIEKIKVGSRVKMIATKQIGVVEEIKGENVTVSFGFARMKVKLDKLMFVD